MRLIRLAASAVLISLVACASAPRARTIAAPVAIPEVIETQSHVDVPLPPPVVKCDSPGTIRHVVVQSFRYLDNSCSGFMPAFDEFIQVGCDKAVPELAHAVGALRAIMVHKERWYSEDDIASRHEFSAEHVQAKLRVASLAWSMMPVRCQSHVPKPMNAHDLDVNIADVDPSWRDCYPDTELLLAHFDKPESAGDVTLLGYVFAVAMEPYLTSVGEQFLRQTLYCNAKTKPNARYPAGPHPFAW